MLLKAITQTNPKCDEKSCESNYAKSKVAGSTSYTPQSYYERVDGENLVSCTSVFLEANMVREGTYKGDQRDAEFTNLLNNALGCAIRAYCDDPVVGPSNIEDAAHGLQDVVHKKGKLSHN
jgi:hypothetical protein